MSHVAVNAIVISQLLDSEGIYSAQSSSAAGIMDGTFGMFGKQNSKQSHSSESTVNSTTITNSAPTDASCGRAFVLLKALVTKWLYDYKHLNDYHAYSLLNNCYRYLCGGSGNNTLLSDPALHRIVYGLMIKLFKCLMVELKKLNVVIVYASFNKIIISATNKHDIPAAEEYISFIIDTLMRKEMFQNLNLKVKSCWNQLVWYDINNWCGGKYVFPQPIEEEVEVSEGDHDTNPMDGLVPESVIEEEHSETLPLGKPRKRRQKSLDSVRGESEDDEAAEDPSSAEHADGADDMAIDGDADSALPSKEDKYKNSQLFSMWAKQSEKNLGGEEGVSVVHTHGSSFVPSVALINPSSQKKKRNKKNKYQEFIQHHPLSDSDDDGVEAAPGEYDFLDSIMGKDSFEENSQSHYSQSRRHYHKPKSITERDYYPDDEVEYDPEEEENELKVYAKPNADRQSLDEDEEGDVEYDDGSIGEGSRHSVHDVEEPMEEEPTGPHFQVEHHWNIISYLPKPVIVYFKYIIEEYMNTFQNKYEGYMISQEKDQTLLGDVTGVSGGEGDELHLHSNPDVDPVHLSILYMCGHVDENTKRIVIDHDTIVRMVQQEMKHVVTVTMLDNMLAIMEQLREVYGPPGSEAARNAFDYSNTTLQHDRSRSKGAKRREEKQKEFNDPVLEFVKVCMHILSLDSHLSDEVATLRRGLLSQLRMREYSPESEFHDVNASYILPDVICSYCNSCRYVCLIGYLS